MNLNLKPTEAMALYTLVEQHRDTMATFNMADLVGTSMATDQMFTDLAVKLIDLMAPGDEPAVDLQEVGYKSLPMKAAAFRGGSFTDSLLKSYRAADQDNRLRLEAAFPGIGAATAAALAK